MNQRKINIMHVIYSFDIGGLENGIVNLINRMNWEKFNHFICCIGYSGRNVENLKRKDVEIIEMGKGDGKELFLPLRIAKRFKNIKTIHKY